MNKFREKFYHKGKKLCFVDFVDDDGDY